VLLDRPAARRVFDLNLEEYRALPAAPAEPAARARAARDWLAEAVHRHRRPADHNARWLQETSDGELRVTRAFWWSEPDVLGAGVLLRPADRDYTSLLLALFERGTDELEARHEWLLARVRTGEAVLALDVRGAGALAPHPINPHPSEEHYGTLYKLGCDLLYLDDSLAAMRVYDVLRAAELARSDPQIGLDGRPLGLFGAGLGAFHGYLAAALDPGIAKVELAGPPLDVRALLSTRLYPAGPDWQSLLPGLARRFTLEDLAPFLAGREGQGRT
jgi:hypothetical protein